MPISNNTSPAIPALHPSHIITKRIGSTTYRVAVHFSQTSHENIGDKVVRLIENDLNISEDNATIKLPQTDRLPERG